MKLYERGRTGRLIHKFKEMKPGDQIRIGIKYPKYIYDVAHRVGLSVSVSNTDEVVRRDDGMPVLVYLVSFL